MFNKFNASLIVCFFWSDWSQTNTICQRIKLLQRICTAKKDTIANTDINACTKLSHSCEHNSYECFLGSAESHCLK